MQWSNIETRISTRRCRSAGRSVQSSPNRATSSAKPFSKVAMPAPMPKATRMKNLPVRLSSNWCASVMSPPFAASRVATAATMPGRLSHRSVRTCWAIVRLMKSRCRKLLRPPRGPRALIRAVLRCGHDTRRCRI